MKRNKELKKLRLENNFSQEYIANKLHVSRKTISSWENERNKISNEHWNEISIIFNKDLKYYNNNNPNIYRQKGNTTVLKILFSIVNILLIFSVINLFTGYFKFSILLQIISICSYSIVYENFRKDIKNINKKVLFFIVLIFIIITLIQIDKIYLYVTIKDVATFFAYFLATLTRSIVITYSFLITLSFNKIKN